VINALTYTPTILITAEKIIVQVQGIKFIKIVSNTQKKYVGIFVPGKLFQASLIFAPKSLGAILGVE
jgi:hypothetical protein